MVVTIATSLLAVPVANQTQSFKSNRSLYNLYIHSIIQAPTLFKSAIKLLADKMMGSTAMTLLALCAGSAFAQTPIRVASFNIRFDNTDIGIADTEMYWNGLGCATNPYQCRVFGVISELGMHASKLVLQPRIDLNITTFKPKL
jgi:hypothetical protein